jgi:hypothetical protein
MWMAALSAGIIVKYIDTSSLDMSTLCFLYICFEEGFVSLLYIYVVSSHMHLHTVRSSR